MPDPFFAFVDQLGAFLVEAHVSLEGMKFRDLPLDALDGLRAPATDDDAMTAAQEGLSKGESQPTRAACYENARIGRIGWHWAYRWVMI